MVQPGPIVFEEQPSRDDVDFLVEAINTFNYDATGFRDGRYLTAFVRNAAGEIVAGFTGFTWGGYAKLEHLWIAKRYRRKGLGRELVAAAEHEARARGCEVMVLDTHDFQAPRFYTKLGYVACGRTEGTPRGSGQTWFRKSLT